MVSGSIKAFNNDMWREKKRGRKGNSFLYLTIRSACPISVSVKSRTSMWFGSMMETYSLFVPNAEIPLNHSLSDFFSSAFFYLKTQSNILSKRFQIAFNSAALG